MADQSNPPPRPARVHYLHDLVPSFDPDLPRHYWVVAALFPVGVEDLAACRRGEPFLLGTALRVGAIYCVYCETSPDAADRSTDPCSGGDHVG